MKSSMKKKSSKLNMMNKTKKWLSKWQIVFCFRGRIQKIYWIKCYKNNNRMIQKKCQRILINCKFNNQNQNNQKKNHCNNSMRSSILMSKLYISQTLCKVLWQIKTNWSYLTVIFLVKIINFITKAKCYGTMILN